MKLQKQKAYLPIQVEAKNKVPMPKNTDLFIIYDEGSIGHLYENEQPFEVATHWLKEEDRFVFSEQELRELLSNAFNAARETKEYQTFGEGVPTNYNYPKSNDYINNLLKQD